MHSEELPDIPSLTLERAAELFGVLSTPVRLHIIRVLCEGEQNVTHLLTQIEASQPNVSRHLQVLYQAGLLVRRRSGHHIFYRLTEAAKAFVCRLVCPDRERAKATVNEPV